MSYRSKTPTLTGALLLCAAFWPSASSFALPQKSQSGGKAQTQTRTNANANKNIDACSLLTGKEITVFLGEALDALNPSVQSAGNLKMSHCLFVTRNFAKSASLDVATPAAGDSSARSLRAFWRNQFHSPLEHDEKRQPAARKIPAQSTFTFGPSDGESESEAETEAGKPRPIPALGEQAYWVGSPLSGALYVLQGDLFLRISVGGLAKESARIAKSKSIAHAALRRLRR
jgi:hypothetical protein